MLDFEKLYKTGLQQYRVYDFKISSAENVHVSWRLFRSVNTSFSISEPYRICLFLKVVFALKMFTHSVPSIHKTRFFLQCSTSSIRGFQKH